MLLEVEQALVLMFLSVFFKKKGLLACSPLPSL